MTGVFAHAAYIENGVLNDDVPPWVVRIQRVVERPGFCLARADCFAFSIFGRRTVVEDLDAIAALQREILADHPRCGTLTLMRTEVSLSADEEIRQRSTWMAAEFKQRTLGSAVVVEEGGLKATVYRSLITGVFLAARSGAAHRVCRSLDEGMGWLFSLEGAPQCSPDELRGLTRALDELGTEFSQNSALAGG